MSELMLSTSPFDAIKRVRDDGSEFWSARELMPLLGYDRWENFQAALDRAQTAATVQGHSAEGLFRGVTKKGGGRPQADFELVRFAAYLVAMSGDPRKEEVAAALNYFAVKTREAEVSRPALTDDEIVHQALQITAKKVEALSARVVELEPKAEFYDELMDADGAFSLNAAAKALGWGRNVMMRRLRELGILQGNRLPYQRYAHHFKVVPTAYVNRRGETVPTATTYVLPSGLDFIRKRLASSQESILV